MEIHNLNLCTFLNPCLSEMPVCVIGYCFQWSKNWGVYSGHD